MEDARMISFHEFLVLLVNTRGYVQFVHKLITEKGEGGLNEGSKGPTHGWMDDGF